MNIYQMTVPTEPYDNKPLYDQYGGEWTRVKAGMWMDQNGSIYEWERLLMEFGPLRTEKKGTW